MTVFEKSVFKQFACLAFILFAAISWAPESALFYVIPIGCAWAGALFMWTILRDREGALKIETGEPGFGGFQGTFPVS